MNNPYEPPKQDSFSDQQRDVESNLSSATGGMLTGLAVVIVGSMITLLILGVLG